MNTHLACKLAKSVVVTPTGRRGATSLCHRDCPSSCTLIPSISVTHPALHLAHCCPTRCPIPHPLRVLANRLRTSTAQSWVLIQARFFEGPPWLSVSRSSTTAVGKSSRPRFALGPASNSVTHDTRFHSSVGSCYPMRHTCTRTRIPEGEHTCAAHRRL